MQSNLFYSRFLQELCVFFLLYVLTCLLTGVVPLPTRWTLAREDRRRYESDQENHEGNPSSRGCSPRGDMSLLQRDQGGTRGCRLAAVLTAPSRARGSAPCVEPECSRIDLSSEECAVFSCDVLFWCRLLSSLPQCFEGLPPPYLGRSGPTGSRSNRCSLAQIRCSQLFW